MTQGKLFVISGASGVGKGTVLKEVMKRRTDLRFSVSATTRPPRPSEADGREYYFVTRQRFEEMIGNGEFLEYDEHNSNYYGTPRAQAEEKMAKGPVLLDIEPMGAAQVRKSAPDAVLIFIMPPSMEELERRLRSRNSGAGRGGGHCDTCPGITRGGCPAGCGKTKKVKFPLDIPEKLGIIQLFRP